MKNFTVQKIFIYVSCIFGILFLILIPPIQAPDEGSHFKKAYVMSEGKFFPEIKDGQEGFYISETLLDYIKEQEDIIEDTDTKWSYTESIAAERQSTVYGKEVFASFSTAATNPIGHIVPMAGIIVAKVVAVIAGREPSVVMMLYFARLFCLILYVVCVSAAICLTPILKKTFCMIGLMPMALFISSSVSYDGLLIGAAFIFTALCFRLLFKEETRVNKYYIIAIGIIAFIFYAIKIVYLPLFLLILFVPKDKYKNQERLKSLAAILFIMAWLIILFKIPGLFRENAAVASDPSTSEQLMFVLKNPLDYLHTFFSTIKQNRDYFVSSTVGVFGLIDTFLYAVVVYPYVFLLFVVGFLEISLENVSVRWYERVSVIISVLAGIFGCFLAMYIYWTSIIEGGGIGVNHIEGVQGRYFIPLMPVLFLCFGNKMLKGKKRVSTIAAHIVDNSVLISIMMLAVSQLTILLRFWVG